ncbi:MAG: ammonia-forming cytochrome c nitrite reductase subunit c552 [Oceanipulchritudo sp.]
MKPTHKAVPGIAAAAGLAVIVAGLLRDRGVKEEWPRLGEVNAKFVASGVPRADPAACVECHREAVEAWERSHHAVANAPLTEADRERLLSADGELIRGRGIRWRKAGNQVVLHEEGLPDGYPVVGSIGITPLIQYLHLAPDGRIQNQDVAWDALQGEWFSVFEGEEGGARIPGEWGHWTGQGMNWDASCAYCHMTEYRKNYDVVEDVYNSEWVHMAIGCSQCHPGMDTHLSQIRNGNNDFKEGLGNVQYMETCATCHARRDQMTADRFAPGDRFDDHYQLTLADIEGIYHPDGQVIGENYVFGSLTMSKMGTAGVTCLDCHEPHSGGFILPVENNALCQRCHGSGLMDAPKIDPLAHSRHPAESTGNLCIECHMPTTNFMGRDPRRDHSMSNPDPRLNIEMGIPDACSKCHNTQSVEWNLRHAEEWYGPDMNRERRAKARLMRDLWDGKEGTPARLKEAVLAEKNRFWKATFVMMFPYIQGDRESWDLLVSLLEDPDPMVRAAAVRVTGMDALDPARQQALLNDPVRSVRISAALSRPRMDPLGGPLEAELLEHIEHTADTPMGALRLAAYHGQRGDPAFARVLALRAIRFDQLNAEAYRLAAIQLHTLGFTDEAMNTLEDGLEVDPQSALIHFNIGLLQAELRNFNEALASLARAVELQPQMESAWYNLVVLYWQIGDMKTARRKLDEALTAIPSSPRLRQLAAQLPPG